jgi:hypothetical protein
LAQRTPNKDILGNSFRNQKSKRDSSFRGSKFNFMDSKASDTQQATSNKPKMETVSGQSGKSNASDGTGGGSNGGKRGDDRDGMKREKGAQNETPSKKDGKPYDFETYIWGLY